MTPARPRAAHLTLFAAMMLAACATAPRPNGAAAAPGDSLAELDSLFRERLAESRTRYTAADVRFMTDMIPHHGQAVEMAELAPTRGASAGVQTLARRIRNGQLDEIALMQQWLRDRGQPVPDTRGGDHHAHHGHGAAMHGMLTAEQMRELEQARGIDFDRLFLVFMIEHHRGAVAMVDALLAADGAAQDPVVFQLASEVKSEQTAEIARMQGMLAALFGGG